MNHSCVLGEDDSVLITPFVSLSGVTLFIWTLNELPAPDEMHIRWQSFPSEVPTLALLSFEGHEHITRILQKHVCDI